MKTTLRRLFAWDSRNIDRLPAGMQKPRYNVRLDRQAHSTTYGAARTPNRFN